MPARLSRIPFPLHQPPGEQATLADGVPSVSVAGLFTLLRDIEGLQRGVQVVGEGLGGDGEAELVGKHHRLFVDEAYARSLEYREFWAQLAAGVAHTARFKRFFHGMLDRGVYLPPSQYEAAFLCSEHSPALIDQTLSAVRATLREG